MIKITKDSVRGSINHSLLGKRVTVCSHNEAMITVPVPMHAELLLKHDSLISYSVQCNNNGTQKVRYMLAV